MMTATITTRTYAYGYLIEVERVRDHTEKRITNPTSEPTLRYQATVHDMESSATLYETEWCDRPSVALYHALGWAKDNAYPEREEGYDR